MTIKTISTYVAAGYTLAVKYSGLLITSTGGVGGTGVSCPAYAAITNAGKVNADAAHNGIRFANGGSVLNQHSGFIDGYAGVVSYGPATTISNYGTIEATGRNPILLFAGGTVNNGTYNNLNGLIAGQEIAIGAAGTLSNFATINADVVMSDGGRVTNGAYDDATALISHYGGVDIFGGTGVVSNYGVIDALRSHAIILGDGGVVTNGSSADTIARIVGREGVTGYGAPVTGTNFGAINVRGFGVYLNAGGSLTNGTGSDLSALVEGYSGATIEGAVGTVINFGTVEGVLPTSFGNGVYLTAGGTVTNGGGADRSALIEGYSGIVINGAGTIKNSGTVSATGTGGFGVSLYTGALTNGSANNATALIEGYTGVYLSAAAAVTNFGTVWGVGDYGGAGVSLNAGGSLANGNATDVSATIKGFSGVDAAGTATITNFGTIDGAAGVAVNLTGAGSALVVEAGSTFLGAVLGGGGTLDLASGTGTLTGLLSSGGNVTVSGSMAATTFQNFGTVEVGAGAKFTDKGAVTLAAGQVVNDAGTLTLGGAKAAVTNAGLIETTGSGVLTIAGALANSGTVSANGGTLTVNAAVTGKGVATIGGGTLDLASAFTQNVTFTGTTGELELGKSQTYTGSITGFSKTGGTSLDLVDIGFVGASEVKGAGTTKSGVLTVTDGTHTAHITLKGDYTASTFTASSDGHGGTIVVDPRTKGAVSAHQFIAAMAGLGRGAGSEIHTGEAWSVEQPTLVKPRVMMA
jgi:hypothetical protein